MTDYGQLPPRLPGEPAVPAMPSATARAASPGRSGYTIEGEIGMIGALAEETSARGRAGGGKAARVILLVLLAMVLLGALLPVVL